MPKMRCPSCGQKYQLPDTAIGRRARCKKCQTVFTVEAPQGEGPIPIADDPFPLAGELDAAVERGAREPAPAHTAATTLPPAMPDMSRLGEAAAATGGKSYWKDLVWSLLFPTSPGNLITFTLLCALLAFYTFLMMLPVFACVLCVLKVIVAIIVVGAYCAFLFNVIVQAAGGDEDLPSIALSDVWNDMILPLSRMIGSVLLVSLPVIAYLIYLGAAGGPGMGTLGPGVLGILSIARDFVILGVLLVLAVFLWPIVVLCVALGGLSSLTRLDLVFVTIVKSFPAYLLTVLLVVGCVLLRGFIEDQVATQIAKASGGIRIDISGAAIATAVIGVVINTYFEIVAMRCVGLYYHHFKHKFAWDWG
jgi:hypothetical protein